MHAIRSMQHEMLNIRDADRQLHCSVLWLLLLHDSHMYIADACNAPCCCTPLHDVAHGVMSPGCCTVRSEFYIVALASIVYMSSWHHAPS